MTGAMLHPDGLHRCPWPGVRPALRRLSRHRMGRAGVRRPRAVREADPRRFPGRAVVDHDPAQARQFPRGLRRISIRRRSRATRRASRGADAGRGHRAQPREDRRHGASARKPISTSWRRAAVSRKLCGTSRRKAEVNSSRRTAQVPAETPLSRAMSKDLTARGFNFVGPTIVYAFMQAVGMVNDHLVTATATPNARRSRRARL